MYTYAFISYINQKSPSPNVLDGIKYLKQAVILSEDDGHENYKTSRFKSTLTLLTHAKSIYEIILNNILAETHPMQAVSICYIKLNLLLIKVLLFEKTASVVSSDFFLKRYLEIESEYYESIALINKLSSNDLAESIGYCEPRIRFALGRLAEVRSDKYMDEAQYMLALDWMKRTQKYFADQFSRLQKFGLMNILESCFNTFNCTFYLEDLKTLIEDPEEMKPLSNDIQIVLSDKFEMYAYIYTLLLQGTTLKWSIERVSSKILEIYDKLSIENKENFKPIFIKMGLNASPKSLGMLNDFEARLKIFLDEISSIDSKAKMLIAQLFEVITAFSKEKPVRATSATELQQLLRYVDSLKVYLVDTSIGTKTQPINEVFIQLEKFINKSMKHCFECGDIASLQVYGSIIQKMQEIHPNFNYITLLQNRFYFISQYICNDVNKKVNEFYNDGALIPIQLNLDSILTLKSLKLSAKSYQMNACINLIDATEKMLTPFKKSIYLSNIRNYISAINRNVPPTNQCYFNLTCCIDVLLEDYPDSTNDNSLVNELLPILQARYISTSDQTILITLKKLQTSNNSRVSKDSEKDRENSAEFNFQFSDNEWSRGINLQYSDQINKLQGEPDSDQIDGPPVVPEDSEEYIKYSVESNSQVSDDDYSFDFVSQNLDQINKTLVVSECSEEYTENKTQVVPLNSEQNNKYKWINNFFDNKLSLITKPLAISDKEMNNTMRSNFQLSNSALAPQVISQNPAVLIKPQAVTNGFVNNSKMFNKKRALDSISPSQVHKPQVTPTNMSSPYKKKK